MVSLFGVPRQGSSGVQSMVAAKAVALAMRSIKRLPLPPPATLSYVSSLLFPSVLVALQAIKETYMPFSK